MEERHECTERVPNVNSEVLQDQKTEVSEGGEVLTCFSNEQMHSICDNQEVGLAPEYMSKSSDQQAEKSGVQQNTMDENKALGLVDVRSESSEKNNQIIPKLAINEQTEVTNLVFSDINTEKSLLPIGVITTSLTNECTAIPFQDGNRDSIGPMNPPVEDIALNSSTEKLETVPIESVNDSRRLGRKDKKNFKAKTKIYSLRSLVSSDRVLRSRTPQSTNTPEPSNNLNNSGTGEEGTREKRVRKRNRKRNLKGKGIKAEEFSMIRNRMRYLLNRMRYEQSLIDAYSSEGWKGFSSDKLKPEKELQRASGEIMRRKLKIRDLFKHLDSLCAEGRFSESLFDSEGQIDSEDIFCAKCGSKEPFLENDIILCDGACDRGFHQFCVVPPLLSADIPPDDEGWLCPGCDCKDDCIDLLNEFQGTNLCVTDSWEKIYPEAAAVGQNSDLALGLPSDDSQDDDYDPDAPANTDKEDKSSSDESGYASAPEELEAPINDDQCLGLPSDDSEDDDFHPNAPDLDDVNEESSSSDFTSDSEDFVGLNDDLSSKSDIPTTPSSRRSLPQRNSNSPSSQQGPRKSAVHNELLSLLESGPDKDGLEPVSGRRQVDRLDYKKLHDEAYGSGSTDSSDETYGSDSNDDRGCSGSGRERRQVDRLDYKKLHDEAYGSGSTDSSDETYGSDNDDKGCSGSRRKRNHINPVPVSLNNGTNHLKLMEIEHSSKRTRKKPAAKIMNNSVTNTPDNSLRSSSSGRKATSSSHTRLSQHESEKLLASFKENQYPDRAVKESLAQELGLSLKRVSKWFENTRWSTRHPSSAEANIAKSASRTGQATGKLPKFEQESGMSFRDAAINGTQHKKSVRANSAGKSGEKKNGKSGTQEAIAQDTTTIKCRKRKSRSDLASDPKDRKEPKKSFAKSPKVNEGQTVGKVKTRRKSF